MDNNNNSDIQIKLHLGERTPRCAQPPWQCPRPTRAPLRSRQQRFPFLTILLGSCSSPSVWPVVNHQRANVAATLRL